MSSVLAVRTKRSAKQFARGPRGGIFTMSIPAGGVDAVDSGPDLAAVGAMSAVADAGHRCRARSRSGARRHLRLCDPPGITDLGQPGQLGHRDSGGALRAPPDRGSRRPVEEHLLPPRLVTRFSSGVPAGGFGAVAPDPDVVSMPTQIWNREPGRRSSQFLAGRLEILECSNSIGHVQGLWQGAPPLLPCWHAYDRRRQPSSFSGSALRWLA